MKDAPHHLKHVQKKVIQSLRKEEAIQENSFNNIHNPTSSAFVAEASPAIDRRANTNQRVPRISGS